MSVNLDVETLEAPLQAPISDPSKPSTSGSKPDQDQDSANPNATKPKRRGGNNKVSVEPIAGQNAPLPPIGGTPTFELNPLEMEPGSKKGAGLLDPSPMDLNTGRKEGEGTDEGLPAPPPPLPPLDQQDQQAETRGSDREPTLQNTGEEGGTNPSGQAPPAPLPGAPPTPPPNEMISQWLEASGEGPAGGAEDGGGGGAAGGAGGGGEFPDIVDNLEEAPVNEEDYLAVQRVETPLLEPVTIQVEPGENSLGEQARQDNPELPRMRAAQSMPKPSAPLPPPPVGKGKGKGSASMPPKRGAKQQPEPRLSSDSLNPADWEPADELPMELPLGPMPDTPPEKLKSNKPPPPPPQGTSSQKTSGPGPSSSRASNPAPPLPPPPGPAVGPLGPYEAPSASATSGGMMAGLSTSSGPSNKMIILVVVVVALLVHDFLLLLCAVATAKSSAFSAWEADDDDAISVVTPIITTDPTGGDEQTGVGLTDPSGASVIVNTDGSINMQTAPGQDMSMGCQAGSWAAESSLTMSQGGQDRMLLGSDGSISLTASPGAPITLGSSSVPAQGRRLLQTPGSSSSAPDITVGAGAGGLLLSSQSAAALAVTQGLNITTLSDGVSIRSGAGTSLTSAGSTQISAQSLGIQLTSANFDSLGISTQGGIGVFASRSISLATSEELGLVATSDVSMTGASVRVAGSSGITFQSTGSSSTGIQIMTSGPMGLSTVGSSSPLSFSSTAGVSVSSAGSSGIDITSESGLALSGTTGLSLLTSGSMAVRASGGLNIDAGVKEVTVNAASVTVTGPVQAAGGQLDLRRIVTGTTPGVVLEDTAGSALRLTPAGGAELASSGAVQVSGFNGDMSLTLDANKDGDDMRLVHNGFPYQSSLSLESSGVGADAVSIQASAATGGLRLGAGSEGVHLTTTGRVNITAQGELITQSDTLTLSSSGTSRIDMEATADGQTLTLAAGGGTYNSSLVLTSAGTDKQAVLIEAARDSGGIQIRAGLTVPGTSRVVNSGEGGAFVITTPDIIGTGFIDIECGTGGVDVVTTGDINVRSSDGIFLKGDLTNIAERVDLKWKGSVQMVYDGSNWILTNVPYLGLGVTAPLYPIHLVSGAYVSVGGVWTDASSRHLKTDIQSLTESQALQTLAGLDPVTFQYKAEQGQVYAGFIAEDVPDLVASADRKGLSSMNIISVLTRVIQIQQRKLEELEKLVHSQAT